MSEERRGRSAEGPGRRRAALRAGRVLMAEAALVSQS